jgi:energy-coupling factor transporter ATP-binding protein EcfA2
MSIRSVHVQRFRSIMGAGLPQCGEMNVLVGKNNAGKSNLLSAIELLLTHLRSGRVAGPWPAPRPLEEFIDRDSSAPVRVGVEFDLPSDINAGLRERLARNAPHLDRSIEQIKSYDTVVFILAGSTSDTEGYVWIEQMAVGKLALRDGDLSSEGIKLLSAGRNVGYELYRNQMSARGYRSDLEALEGIRSPEGHPALDFVFRQPREQRMFYLDMRGRMRTELRGQLEALLGSANSVEEFTSGLNRLVADTREKMEISNKRETEGTLAAFAGDTRTAPPYAEWLIQQFGAISFLHIRETKQPIGRDEANALLRLKIRRGGRERLEIIQETVRSLLGVTVDAFEGGTASERAAEMDVDNFLVEANGAGIREALRLVLDLELKNPKILFIEEPEVHLHPGLSRVVARYLRAESRDVQMFITTHSTDFVDSVSFHNVYLVSRDSKNRTICQRMDPEQGPVKIPAELGLRLSTVFMFSRLVFVDGPSDENLLRQLAGKLNIDIAKSEVGFVHMGGVRNFAHFAAEGTLDLLSKRRIRMWFVTDRDEADDSVVKRMIEGLSGRAKLTVLKGRELENYLLSEAAVAAYIEEKQKAAGSNGQRPDLESVRQAIREESLSLKDEVIRLRLEKRLLAPVFLHSRKVTGSVDERIASAIEQLTVRRDGVGRERRLIVEDVERDWEGQALSCAPGSVILERVAKRFGVAFSKDKGDSERLARLMPQASVDAELKALLSEIGAEDASATSSQ